MTVWVLGLVPQYGLWLVAVTTLASCLALPFPASIVMLAAGGFAAAGDLVLWQVIAAALGGAVMGDQIGYGAGRLGGTPLVARLAQGSTTAARARARAEAAMARHGALAVFLTRWLFSPLGPYVNLLSGAMRHGWARFTFWGVLGEAVWCGLYVLMGQAFAGRLQAASDMLSSMLGLVATATAALLLGLWLRALAQEQGK